MYRRELRHYGVKGMKWGVRRYQDKTGRLTPAGRKRYSENTKLTRYDKLYSKYKKQGYADEDAERTARGRLKVERVLAVTGTVALTAAVGYGAYKLSKSGKLNRPKPNSNLAGFMLDNKTGLELQSNTETVSDALKRVNPKFSMFDKNYYMNCGNCAIAFEARLRGYNVEALGNPNGMAISHMGQFFKGFKSESFKQIDIDPQQLASNVSMRGKQVEQIMKQNILSQCSSSDGRGMLFFPADFGSHWVSWTKTGDNVTFHNSQDPSVDLVKQVFSHYRYHRNSVSAGLTSIRLDDLEFNTDNIHSVITNVSKNAVQTAEKFDTYISKGYDFVTNFPL